MGQNGEPLRWLSPRFYAVSTDAVPERDRFDYWRSHFQGVAMTPLEGGADDYGARAAGCGGDDGVLFNALECDPNSASFADGDSSYVRLNVMLHGCCHVTHGDDRRDVVAPGPGFSLFDYSRASRADTPTGYLSHMLTLPRALVIRAMGGDPFIGRETLRMLPETPLGLVLKQQMQAMARHGPAMDAQETDAAMQALSGLAIAYLTRFGRPGGQGNPTDDALFAAACSYIDRHKENPALTASFIAAALGCSRAHLYRLFERRGLGVAEHVRQARLSHARVLLRLPELDMGDVALRCGYADPSAFGKAFRRAFGVTPRDWRMALN
jgi:AraC-like DNA-binding protein